MEIAKKLTFAEMQQHQDAKLVNSNLENLTTALMNIRQERQEIKKREKALNDLEAEINALAATIESGDLVDVADVSKLYHQARDHNRRTL